MKISLISDQSETIDAISIDLNFSRICERANLLNLDCALLLIGGNQSTTSQVTVLLIAPVIITLEIIERLGATTGVNLRKLRGSLKIYFFTGVVRE